MIEIAVLGGGCFWQVEEAFRVLSGVISTEVGYMGGDFENPLHLDVCARITGHAEVAKITFETDQISYREILLNFWSIHDPTTLNRQGPDRGEQYRSVIFFGSQAQQMEAEASVKVAQQQFEQPIVTQIKAAKEFWPAKEEHQKYLFKKAQKLSQLQ